MSTSPRFGFLNYSYGFAEIEKKKSFWNTLTRQKTEFFWWIQSELENTDLKPSPLHYGINFKKGMTLDILAKPSSNNIYVVLPKEAKNLTLLQKQHWLFLAREMLESAYGKLESSPQGAIQGFQQKFRSFMCPIHLINEKFSKTTDEALYQKLIKKLEAKLKFVGREQDIPSP